MFIFMTSEERTWKGYAASEKEEERRKRTHRLHNGLDGAVGYWMYYLDVAYG
jgi:hypothetical protein